MRHANPVSVWTRFAVLPLLALAVWSREWTDRDKAELPAQFRSRVLSVTYAIQVAGMAILVYGLVELDLLAVVSACSSPRPPRPGSSTAWRCCTRT
jgi:hypothetical protein